jgi:hypothetical protein
MASPVARWVLPVPWAEEHHVLAGGDEVEGSEVGDGVPFQPAGVVEVEFFQGFAGGEPGGADTAFAAVGFAGGDLALQAGDQELLVRPRLCPSTLGQSPDRLAQRWRLQGPGEEDQLGGDVARRRGRGARRH